MTLVKSINIIRILIVTYKEGKMKNIYEYLKEISQAEYHEVDIKLEKYNLVKGQAKLLTVIKENDGATQNELAEIFNIKYSSMSERLRKLETLEYISKLVDENNLKYKRVFITPEGKKVATQCKRILKSFEDKKYKGFSKKDVKKLEEYLEKILNNMKNRNSTNH